MSAALELTPLRRYDRACAYCESPDPIGRHYGKVVCSRCLEAFTEAPDVVPTPDAMAVSEKRLRSLIQYLSGGRTFKPLWMRALEKRERQRT